jgi:hypothetical protein
MKINLDELELKTAVREFIANQGISIQDKDISIELIAGRGTNGHRAEVEIVPAGSEANTAEEAEVSDDEPAVPFDFGETEEDS